MAATLAAIDVPAPALPALPVSENRVPEPEEKPEAPGESSSSDSSEDESPAKEVPNVVFKDKKEAIEAFKELLKEKVNIDFFDIECRNPCLLLLSRMSQAQLIGNKRRE
jgi:hypothetical protein